MWEAIASNRRRSWFLLIVLGALLVGLGFGLGMLIDRQMGGWLGAASALFLWLVHFTGAVLHGDSLLLRSARAKEIGKSDAPRLWNIVEEMTIASGLGTMPRIFIIDHLGPNAFAVGRNPEKAAVAVTLGLLKRLNRDELQGVIAHEIAHIKNHDVQFMTLASVTLGTISLISETLVLIRYSGRRFRFRWIERAHFIRFVLYNIVPIVAAVSAQLLFFACSRRREYLADASAARFTRYPDGLASALEKIALRAGPMMFTSRALAPLYVVNPLQGRTRDNLFSTHPSTDRRIRILRGMGGRAGYVDYEAAFKKTYGDQRHCIGSRTLHLEKSVTARSPSVENRQEVIERVREVTDFLDRMSFFIPIPCICGVRIKAPPNLERKSIRCPRCGREHPIPHAKTLPVAVPSNSGEQRAVLHYERKGEGWESFKCSCGKVVQLSPSFVLPSIRCRKCKQKIEIVAAQPQLRA